MCVSCLAAGARLLGPRGGALRHESSAAALMAVSGNYAAPAPPPPARPPASAGDQHGNIRVWDLTANACSCELVPEVGTGELTARSCSPPAHACLPPLPVCTGWSPRPQRLVPRGPAAAGHGGAAAPPVASAPTPVCRALHAAVRSLTVAMDGSLVVAANNSGTCYVWRAMRGSYLTTHFEPLHKLRAHQGGAGCRPAQRRQRALCVCVCGMRRCAGCAGSLTCAWRAWTR